MYVCLFVCFPTALQKQKSSGNNSCLCLCVFVSLKCMHAALSALLSPAVRGCLLPLTLSITWWHNRSIIVFHACLHGRPTGLDLPVRAYLMGWLISPLPSIPTTSLCLLLCQNGLRRRLSLLSFFLSLPPLSQRVFVTRDHVWEKRDGAREKSRTASKDFYPAYWLSAAAVACCFLSDLDFIQQQNGLQIN